MPNMNISWTRDAGDENYIYGMPGGTIGPNGGNRTVSVNFGQTFSLSSSGSGPGNTAIRRLNSQTLGLDDRQGAGADGDYNDMIVYVSGGSFTNDNTLSGPPATYGCMDPNAVNYNSSANVNSGCVYAYPNPQLRINGSTSSPTIVEGDSITVTWSASDTQYMYTGSITGEGAPGTLSSSSYANGTFVAQPTADTTYTYSVSYAPPTRYDSFSISVEVKQIPEITVRFLGNPGNTILRGQSATLDWTVSGDATSLSISPDYGSQNLSGQITVSPTVSTTYILYASTPGFGGRLQDSESITLTVIQPPSASLTVPSTINWGDPSYEVEFDFENVTSYDVTAEYTDLDGVVVTHAAFTAADPSQTIVNLLIADETSSTIPRWNSRGYSNGKVKLKAYGTNGQFVEKESLFNIIIDELPDAIDIPSSEDKFLGEEPVITPDVTVTSDNIVIDDVDIPVEITADSPIQVEIDASGVWYEVRQT
jgi:hypothetical protein